MRERQASGSPDDEKEEVGGGGGRGAGCGRGWRGVTEEEEGAAKEVGCGMSTGGGRNPISIGSINRPDASATVSRSISSAASCRCALLLPLPPPSCCSSNRSRRLFTRQAHINKLVDEGRDGDSHHLVEGLVGEGGG